MHYTQRYIEEPARGEQGNDYNWVEVCGRCMYVYERESNVRVDYERALQWIASRRICPPVQDNKSIDHIDKYHYHYMHLSIQPPYYMYVLHTQDDIHTYHYVHLYSYEK